MTLNPWLTLFLLPSSKGFPKLFPVLSCESQCLVPSVIGERLPVDNWYSNQSDYRIWPVQATYLLLLGVLPWIILVEPWDFPLHQVQNMVPIIPLFHYSPLHSCTQHNSSCSHSPVFPQSTKEIFYVSMPGHPHIPVPFGPLPVI